jgi:hypothetical protein
MRYETTIQYKDTNLDIIGTYTAGEEQVRYYSDMSGYPGSGPEFDFISVKINDWDITILLTDTEAEELSDMIIQQIEA